jgi:hypothetical protein
MKFYYRFFFPSVKCVLFRKKSTFFFYSKEFLKKTLGRAHWGRGGGGDLQESSFCDPSADEDGQNPKHLGNDLLREVKCKNLASKLCAISKPYLKTLFWKKHFVQQQQPVQNQ